MATAPSPNDLTRQQLDELDALLQRMLAQPLAPPDLSSPAPVPAPVTSEFLPPPIPQQKESPPIPWAFVPPTHRVEPPPPPQLLAAPVSELPRPAVESLPTPRSHVPPPPSTPTAPLPMPAAPPSWPGYAPNPTIAANPEPMAAPCEPVAWPLVPLVAFNQLVNSVLGIFGWPGRVLRSGFIKNVLGLIGLSLMVYTALKVASVYLSLPFPIPWPR